MQKLPPFLALEFPQPESSLRLQIRGARRISPFCSSWREINVADDLFSSVGGMRRSLKISIFPWQAGEGGFKRFRAEGGKRTPNPQWGGPAQTRTPHVPRLSQRGIPPLCLGRHRRGSGLGGTPPLGGWGSFSLPELVQCHPLPSSSASSSTARVKQKPTAWPETSATKMFWAGSARALSKALSFHAECPRSRAIFAKLPKSGAAQALRTLWCKPPSRAGPRRRASWARRTRARCRRRRRRPRRRRAARPRHRRSPGARCRRPPRRPSSSRSRPRRSAAAD